VLGRSATGGEKKVSGSTYRAKVLTDPHDVFRGISKYRTWKYSRALRINFSQR